MDASPESASMRIRLLYRTFVGGPRRPMPGPNAKRFAFGRDRPEDPFPGLHSDRRIKPGIGNIPDSSTKYFMAE
jgi:hypothetical protein